MTASTIPSLPMTGFGGGCVHSFADDFDRANTAEGESLGGRWRPQPLVHIDTNKAQLDFSLGANDAKSETAVRNATRLCFLDQRLQATIAESIGTDTGANNRNWYLRGRETQGRGGPSNSYVGHLEQGGGGGGRTIRIERARGGTVVLYLSGGDEGELGAQTFDIIDGTGGDAGKVSLEYTGNGEGSGVVLDTDPIFYGYFFGIGLRAQTQAGGALIGSITQDDFSITEI